VEEAVVQVLVLLLVAALVAVGARRLKLPYTLALVLAGIGLGMLHLHELAGLHLTPELLLAVFLPALLFEAAYHVQLRRFLQDAPAILTLALPGVAVAVVVTSLASFALLQLTGSALALPIGTAFLFGAVISATDPISVLALFKSLGVNRRLYLLVEGESLLNDGVAVVIFAIVAAVLGIHTAHGHAPELAGVGAVVAYGLKTFVWMVGAGVVSGVVLGALISGLTRVVDDKLIETSLTFVLAYGSFLLAEHIGASGVLACVSAGITLNTLGTPYGMSPQTRVAIVDFWEFMAFFANTFVFLLVGLELDTVALAAGVLPVTLAFVAVLAGRAVAIYGLAPVMGRVFGRLRPIPRTWLHVMVWGGLRGSLSMVLVIGLPQDFAGREALLTLVFGVVALSLFLQGLTMGPLLRLLGVTESGSRIDDYERERARAMMARAALREVDKAASSYAYSPRVTERVRAHYSRRVTEHEAEAARLAGDALPVERAQEAALHLLTIEEEALRHAVVDGIVVGEVAEELFADIALRREQLSHDDDAAHLKTTLDRLLPVLPGTADSEDPGEAEPA
jgi:CPA1 family monovalent cation:H+ antiporter